MINPKLSIELVPKTSWYINIRYNFDKKTWDMVRKYIYKKFNYHCAICGIKTRLECHEIFKYDDKKLTQELTGLIAICHDCHMVKHIGLSKVKGNEEKSKKHLMLINEWSLEDATNYINECFNIYYERSKYKWDINLDFLELILKEIINEVKDYESKTQKNDV